MTRSRQPGGLKAELYYDFSPVAPFRGYTRLEARSKWLHRGEFRSTVLRESGTGRTLTGVALTAPASGDLARWQVVVRPEGDSRVLASVLLSDIDADFGWLDGSAEDVVSLYGYTYTSMLEGVVITPDPTTPASTTGLSTWSQALDVRTGPAETVALGLISDHFGPAAPVTAARFSRLNIPASLGRGATVTAGQHRLPTLLDELRVICQEGGITVRLEQGAPGVVDVVVTTQQQRPEVRLTRETGTLMGLRVRRSTAVATSVLVGGKGDDAARVFTQVNATAPTGGWAYPRRTFVNATSEDELEPMRQVARAELSELNQPTSVSLNPAPTARWVAGVDFDLGDRLVIDEGGATVDARVEEIVTTHAGAGAPSVTAESGQPMDPAAARLASRINGLTRALRRETT